VGVTVDRVFLVGCGRSGTTVVYDTMAAHPDTAWFSRWTDASLQPRLAAAAPLYRRLFPPATGAVRRFLPYPSEGYRLWDAALALEPDEVNGPLDASHVTVARARAVEACVSGHVRHSGGSCFLNKNTRNSRRMPFLAALYPAAVYIHVVRHPLDVVASLLEIEWWPGLALWTEGGRTVASFGDDPVVRARLAADLWRAETEQVLDASTALPADRYLELRYEAFVDEPAARTGDLLASIGLDDHPTVGRFASLVRASSVGGWRRRLTEAQQEAAVPAVEGLAKRLGYDL
jgi:hypothetical protein